MPVDSQAPPDVIVSSTEDGEDFSRQAIVDNQSDRPKSRPPLSPHSASEIKSWTPLPVVYQTTSQAG